MRNTKLQILSALAGVALSAVSVRASGTDTWQGNTDTNWSTAGNWSAGTGGSAPPVNGDSLVFGAAGLGGASLNNDISSLSVNKLTFNSGASSFTFGGNTLTLGSGGIDASGLTSGTETFTPTITIGTGLQRWNVGAGATLAFGSLGAGADAADLYTPNGAMVILSSSGTKTTTTADGWGWRSGAVAGTGPLGPGMVIDNGNNTYDWASVGTQTAGTSHAIVAATYTTAVNGDAHNVKVTGNTTVSVNGSWASLLVSGATLTVNGTQVYIDTGIILENGGIVAGSKPIKSNADGLYIYTPDSGTISASIQNNGANAKLLYKAGPGTLSLTGGNSYSGGTVLYDGTVSVGATTALGTGPLSFKGGNLDCSSANLVNANNNAQNWNADFTFAGSQNLDLGTGAVALGATRQVTVSANTLTVGGIISGASYGLTKVGNGTLKLTGVNTYGGATSVNAGKLEVGTAGTGIASGSAVTVNSNGTLLVDSGATVGSSTVAVAGGTVSGAGTISGDTTINSSGVLTPRPAGSNATTLSFGGSLTLASASANFTVSTSAAGSNDKVNYGSSGTLTLDNSDTINITGTTFDSASDYTLFASTSGTVSMATRPTLKINGVTSDQTSPGSYQLNISGSSVALHYIQAAVPPTVNSASASPSSLGHYQTTTVTVNVTPASGKTITSVSVGVDGLGGAGDPTTLSGPGGDGAGNWTGIFTVPVNLAAGSYSISGTVNQSDGGSAPWSVSGITVTTASPIWSGGGSDNKWSTGGNWNIGHGPGSGDNVAFAGSTQLTNNLDGSVGIVSLTFNSNSGSFDITNATSTLTVSGGVTNNSANAQTLDVPVVLSGAPTTINVAAGNVAISRPISDTGGGFTLVGNNTLTLTGTNTFTGGLTITNGTLQIGGAGQLGGGNYAGNVDLESTMSYSSMAGQTLSGAISGAGALVVSNATLTLTGPNTFSGGVTLSNGVVGVGNNAGLGTGALTLDGGTVQNSAGIGTVNDIAVGAGGGTIKLGATSDFWVGGNLTGTGNLVLGGSSPGVNSLNVAFSANTMSGGSITIPLTGNNQTVVRFKSTTSGNAGIPWSVGGAPDRFVTLDFGTGTIEFGSLTGAGILAGNGAGTKIVQVGGLNADCTFAGKFLDGSGVLEVNKVGTGKLTLTGSATAISGGIFIYDGILNVGSANALNAPTTLTFGGGTLQYSAANQVDYAARLVNSGSPIVIDLNGTNVTFASAIPNNNFGGLVLTNSTGSGKLTFTANSLYYGDTYINGGTLALSGAGNISGTANIIVGSGGVFDISASAYTLGSAQTLSGFGTVTGAVTTANIGSFISPGGAGVVGALTFKNNLTMNSGGAATFDLSTNSVSGNDQVVVNGNLRLGTADTIHVNAMTDGGNLDETGDYVLFDVTGTLTMSSIPVLVFDNTPPSDSANWWVRASGNKVVLHYSVNPPPLVTSVIVTNVADSSTVAARGQLVTVYATVQKTLNNISSVTVDLSPIGGAATQAMTLVTSSGSTYEYTYGPVAVGPSAVVGADSIGVEATDTGSVVGTGAATLTVNSTTETWSGLAADDNWSSDANWVSGLAPGYAGDTLLFTGNTRLSPNLAADYDLAGLTFDGSADSFTIGSTSGKSLTLSGVLNNSSSASQVISAPVVLNNGSSISDSGWGITLSGTVSGSGLTVSSGTVTLAGANAYTGDTTLSAGTLKAAHSAAIPSGAGKGNVILGSGTTLDVNGTNVSMNGLSDAGTIDNTGLDAATVTIGNGNASSTYTGMIVNSLGAISLEKVGSGTFTISKNNNYFGDTRILGGSVVLPNGADSAFGTGSLTLSNATLVVQAGGGGSWNSANACYIGNKLVIPAGTTNLVDDSVNNYGNLWVAGDNIQWTGTGTLKFQNNGGVNQPGLIWNGNPLATFNGTIILGSAANSNSFVFNGIAYSSVSSGGTGVEVTTFDASSTAWVLGDIGYSLTQVSDPGCTNIKMGSISGSNPNSVLKGSPSSTAPTTFEVGAKNTSTTFAGKIQDWGAGGTCLTKVGTGTLTLSGANTYSGATTVSNGTLLVNGSVASPVVVDGGVFGGTGTVNGLVTVNSGGTLAPGASIGILTVNNNLTIAGNLLFELDRSLAPGQTNDYVVVSGGITNSGSGTLTLNNLGSALAPGNTFQLFNQPVVGGELLTLAPALGGGLTWSNRLAIDGTVVVASAVVVPGPALLTSHISGNTLALSWPAGQGWTLQTQTNSLSRGLGTNWVTLVPSSAGISSTNITVDKAIPSAFYRLVYP